MYKLTSSIPEEKSLAGLTVLVTRPRHQAQALLRLIKAKGGNAVGLSTVKIIPPVDFSSIKTGLENRDQYHFAIFLSANAVSFVAPYWKKTSLSIIAIGTGTARALKKIGINDYKIPKIFSTEGILAMQELQNLSGKSVLIFCGADSPQLPVLKNSLQKNGAVQVKEVICYRRQKPKPFSEKKMDLLKHKGVNVLVSTSQESLKNLCSLVPPSHLAWLKSLPLIVISQKMVDLSQQMGFKSTTILVENLTNHRILEGLKKIQEEQKYGRLLPF